MSLQQNFQTLTELNNRPLIGHPLDTQRVLEFLEAIRDDKTEEGKQWKNQEFVKEELRKKKVNEEMIEKILDLHKVVMMDDFGAVKKYFGTASSE